MIVGLGLGDCEIVEVVVGGILGPSLSELVGCLMVRVRRLVRSGVVVLSEE